MNETYSRLEFDIICERVAQRASFSLGKKRVLESQPSFSRLSVQRDLKQLEAAMQLLVSFGPLSFAGISDVHPSLTRAQKGGILPVEEIVAVGRFMQGSTRLKNHYFGLDKSFAALDDLFESIQNPLHVSKRIDHCFSEQGEVLDRASDTLFGIRKDLVQKRSQLEAKTQEFLSKNKEALVEPVVTFQQGRRTFLIRLSDKNKFDGTLYGTSASGQSVYFEPAAIARIHADVLSAQVLEQEEIARICRDISREIGDVAQQLSANLDTCAVIDSVFAKADWGRIQEGCVATLTEDTLYLEKARHPLIDKKLVVANTYALKPPYHMIIISGPNTGGKSVSLKTMGLSVVMTLAGFPVLADKAEVMMVDNVFVDIGDQQSIEKSLSSFSAHLETVKRVCEHATSKSLILLDELGSQTDPLEGEALSMAILDHFRSVGSTVIATTHFSRLKQYGTRHADILIASVAFDMETLSPTYIYKEHVMGESNALSIAKRLGLDARIVDKAWEYKKESTQEADALLEILELKIKENDSLNETLEAQLKALERQRIEDHAKQERLIQQIQAEKQTWLDEKNDAYNAELNDLRIQIEKLNVTHSKPQERKEVLQRIEKAKPVSTVDPISVKDRVSINSTGQLGVVEKIEKQTAFVSVGTMTLQVDLHKLTRVGGPVVSKKPKRKAHSVSKVTPQKMELNIIGYRVAEAMPEVERFVDSCVLNRVNSFRIVHGHGSGVLRQAVHDYLRKNKHIGSFELAAVNEGGSGATRVVLKQ